MPRGPWLHVAVNRAVCDIFSVVLNVQLRVRPLPSLFVLVRACPACRPGGSLKFIWLHLGLPLSPPGPVLGWASYLECSSRHRSSEGPASETGALSLVVRGTFPLVSLCLQHVPRQGNTTRLMRLLRRLVVTNLALSFSVSQRRRRRRNSCLTSAGSTSTALATLAFPMFALFISFEFFPSVAPPFGRT